MSDKYINNKRERDENGLIITLGKLEQGYCYLDDSLVTERSKIKIPFDDFKFQNDSLVNGNQDTKTKVIPEQEEVIPLLASKVETTLKQPIILPTCSQWFSLDTIHDIEMKNLPEFFCHKYPSKTPEVYKEYRNYIINLYRENPNAYLTSTSKY
jgi:hypothetical protein